MAGLGNTGGRLDSVRRRGIQAVGGSCDRVGSGVERSLRGGVPRLLQGYSRVIARSDSFKGVRARLGSRVGGQMRRCVRRAILPSFRISVRR